MEGLEFSDEEIENDSEHEDLLDTLLNKGGPKFRIALFSDFFYPRLGGVEMHIYQLGQCLQERGHKVIVITNTYETRQGIRYLSNGLKVYYLPIYGMFSQSSIPTLLCRLPLFRNIYIREGIEIVHGHQVTAMLQYEGLLIAKSLGLKTVFTDHSLFNFSDPENIVLNKLTKTMHSELDAAVCVSHVNKENFTLRCAFNPNKIYVISNAVSTSNFTPNPGLRYPLNKINIVILSRLTYRKGLDLIVNIIPRICQKYPQVYFIIGGDGNKKELLVDVRDKYCLNDRMEFLGAVPHNKVRGVLCRGHIFLNPSLIEAFCIALLEAASCGLLVVSTNVGGIPEVLPPDMVYLADPEESAIEAKLEEAIKKVKNIPSQEYHERVKSLYSWRRVATKVEVVYKNIMKTKNNSLGDRIKLSLSSGPINGFFLAMVIICYAMLIWICEFFVPRDEIDMAVDFPVNEYKKNKEMYGDHEFRVDNRNED